MTDHQEQKHSPPLIYTLMGDVRSISKQRITARRILSFTTQQEMILTIDLERQHAGRRPYNGALHLDMSVYFVSELPLYRQTKIRTILSKSRRKVSDSNYNISKPFISTLIGFIEKIGEGILFNAGTLISSVNCAKKFTDNDEPFLEFSITELR